MLAAGFAKWAASRARGRFGCIAPAPDPPREPVTEGRVEPDLAACAVAIVDRPDLARLDGAKKAAVVLRLVRMRHRREPARDVVVTNTGEHLRLIGVGQGAQGEPCRFDHSAERHFRQAILRR